MFFCTGVTHAQLVPTIFTSQLQTRSSHSLVLLISDSAVTGCYEYLPAADLQVGWRSMKMPPITTAIGAYLVLIVLTVQPRGTHSELASVA